jgi:hypothetical protein
VERRHKHKKRITSKLKEENDVNPAAPYRITEAALLAISPDCFFWLEE